MAMVRFRGDAVPVAQETHVTPANVGIGDAFYLTINGRSVSFVATAATVAHVTAGLANAWNGTGLAEFLEATAIDRGTHLELKADVAGRPFEVNASTTDGDAADTQTLAVTTVVSSAGPQHWDTASNWSTGTVPADGDDVVLENSSGELLYGLDQSAVTLASLTIQRSYSGKIGLPVNNPNGYVEYRPSYLKIGATNVLVGTGIGPGSSRLKIDTGTAATSVSVSHTAAPESGGAGVAILWKGTHATNQLTVIKGTVGVALMAGESATLAQLRVGQADQPASDAVVLVGGGVTLAAVQQVNGICTTRSGVTSVQLHAGEFGLVGDAACTTLNVYGGALRCYSTGTIGTLELAGGTADFSRDLRGRTVTNCLVHTGSTLHDPGKSVSWSNGVKLNRTRLTGVVLDLGTHLTLTPSAF
jgi:hypothetical protein